MALLFLAASSTSFLVTPVSADPPTERVARPDNPSVKGRKTTADEAPEIVDACGTDLITGFELPDTQKPYARETVAFSVNVGDEVVPYRLMSYTVLPGDSVEIEAVLGARGSIYNACASEGELVRLDGDEWTWWAPDEPGVYSVFVTEEISESVLKLQMLVLEPYNGEATLDGYRFGDYETVPLRGNPKYNTPRGFVRVTPDLQNLWLSPHFQLRQFLCKQKKGEYPQFALVHTRLLLKLELLLEKVNNAGVGANTFAVLSGFRTPHYNRAIGNKTRYSRHLYGDAADIYVDTDGDGRMDDLNGDGKVTRADAERLASLIEKSYKSVWYKPFIGGLGIYGPKPHRGPFIHVDTRGFRARW